MPARVAIIVLAIGCAPGPVDDADTLEQPILGGSADAGLRHTRVFILGMTWLPDAGSSICSASLVGPRTLLTAAHCLDLGRHPGATSVSVIASNKADTSSLTSADVHRMVEYRLHPSWVTSSNEADYDIAVLLLATVPAGLTPLPISRAAPATGQAITLAGYGRDDPQDALSSGTKRAAAASITAVGPRTFDFGISGQLGICSGDSGGPGLRLFPDGVERVIGVHSTTPSLAICGDGQDNRVDFHAAFIDAFIAQRDTPPVADAGSDAGSDAGTRDAGTPPPPDSGTPGPDAGQPMTPADGGFIEPEVQGGCGCSASPLPLPLLLAAALATRRRHRHPRLTAGSASPSADTPASR